MGSPHSTCLVGCATILVLFAIGRRLYSDGVGLLAALLLALAPFHVTQSQILKPPAATTLWAALAFLLALRLAARPSFGNAILGVESGKHFNGVPRLVAIFPRQIIVGPAAQGHGRGLDRRMTGHHDDHRVEVLYANLLEQIDARHLPHVDVGHDQGERNSNSSQTLTTVCSH